MQNKVYLLDISNMMIIIAIQIGRSILTNNAKLKLKNSTIKPDTGDPIAIPATFNA